MSNSERTQQSPWWFVISVILFLIWESRALRFAWTLDLSNRYGLIAFLLWIISSIFIALHFHSNLRNGTWWTLALLCCLAGKLGDMEVLKHVGIAVAVAGILPNTATRIICLIGAMSWTTALSWFSEHYYLFNPDRLRIPMALFATVSMATLSKGSSSQSTIP